MSKKRNDPDSLVLKQKKGTWRRFIKLFPKCRLPWVWIVLYLLFSVGVVNLGISETDYTAQLYAGDTSAALVVKLIAVLLVNMIGSSLLVFVGGITSARINRNMRTVLLDKVLRLPMDYFKDENPREAVYRIVQNAIVVDSTIMLVILPLLTAGYTALSILGRVFQYDWRLSVILLAFVPLQVLIAFLFGRLNFSLSERDAAVNAGLTEKLAELITNIPLAKAFAREQKETESGESLTARLYKINIKGSWISQFKDLSETVVSLLQAVVIVLVGVLLLHNGEISTRSWVAFFLFSSLFCGAVTQFMMYWNNLKIIQGGALRVTEIMDAPEEDTSGLPCPHLSGGIRLEHVRFGYDEEKPVLLDVSCDFPDDCVTALLGVSGCGKTTLVNLITRLYTPQEGSITVEGQPVHGYALNDYREQFVMVSQNGMLFSGSIRENVCYGNGSVSDEALIRALKQAGAYSFVMALPDGLETRLEEYGSNLSGGQRQRLSVARALLSQAHYLILDEPVASMDAIATSELMEVLGTVAKGRCMIIIAHTPAVLPLAQRVVVVEDGAVTAQGAPAEVRERSRFLREFTGEKVAQ